VSPERTSFTVRHEAGSPELNLDSDARVWRQAAVQSFSKDCTHQKDYPNLKTQVRAFWTDTDLYFLFRCPYDVLNLWPADNSKAHVNLWDRDVVEMFLGYDWENIKHYREFEMAPTGDWIDLAIDLNRDSFDPNWRSGWKTMARIDKQNKIWYAAARIPLSSIGGPKVEPGTQWRMNLYRIDGLGEDPQRHFLCWQPTCVEHRDPNHVPEHFGTLIFAP
jgi:Carbohydrate family 9 binding domain-like